MKFDYDKRKEMLKKRMNREPKHDEIINAAHDVGLANEYLLGRMEEMEKAVEENQIVHQKMKEKAVSSDGLKLKDLEDILKDSPY